VVFVQASEVIFGGHGQMELGQGWYALLADNITGCIFGWIVDIIVYKHGQALTTVDITILNTERFEPY
jgi:hypothetical protein